MAVENIGDNTKEVVKTREWILRRRRRILRRRILDLWILLPLTLGTKTELNYIEYRVRTCYIITAEMTCVMKITR